ncbi:MAG: 50S ribosomal protein L22 [Patescibacteria group bacterium]
MEVRAVAKSVRISPKKARPVVKALRGKSIPEALNALRFDVTKTSSIVYKLLFSAMSNGKNNYNLKEDNLRIKTLTVDSGPSFKRYWYRSRGSADRLIKRTSHFTVVLEEINPSLVKKPVAAAPAAPKGETKDAKTTSTKPMGDIKDQKVAKQTSSRKVTTTRTTNK